MDLSTFNISHKFSMSVHKRSNGEVYEIMGENSSIVKSAVINKQIENPLVEANITIRYSPSIYRLVEVGDVISYFENELTVDYEIAYKRKHVFFVMNVVNDEDRYEQMLMCRNGGHWLMRNAFFLKIEKDETTSQAIERMAKQKNIPIDFIESTSYKHQAKVFPKSSLHEVWYDLLMVNILEERLLYNMRFSDIGLVLEKIDIKKKLWVFEASRKYANILRPKRSVSISHPDFTNIAIAIRSQEQSNLASLVDNNESSIEKKTNLDSVSLYGEFPTEIDVTNYGKQEEVGDRLQDIVDNGYPVDSMDFRTYAINSLTPSDAVVINYPNIGGLGLYFIETMSTIINDKSYWNDLHVIKRRNLQPDLIAQLSAAEGEEASDLASLVD